MDYQAYVSSALYIYFIQFLLGYGLIFVVDGSWWY